uniref:Uncharacterized protein n=1 Tax=Streptomyces sp. NBC_00049 TaxID=2903617 RepID=A0AAU2JSN4_9ACTN
MIHRFRPPRWFACAALAAAALTPAVPACAWPLAATPAGGAAAVRAHGATAPAPDDDYEELAGSAAGAGRERPGRPAGEPANRETVIASRPLAVRPRTEPRPPPKVVPTPPAPVNAPVTALGTEPNERAADLAAHILPLGTGFALMGLGLGYLGMRLRRGL